MITAILAILLQQAIPPEPPFADTGLSRDAQYLLRAHSEAWFEHWSEGDQCTRGEATPWLSGGAYKQVAPTAAVETHLLRQGANITIIQWGCEYYVASIRFVSRSAAKPAIRVADALRALRGLGAKTVFDLSKAEATIRRNGNLAEHSELPIPGDGSEFLQTRVTITRSGTNFVEFQLLKGPL